MSRSVWFQPPASPASAGSILNLKLSQGRAAVKLYRVPALRVVCRTGQWGRGRRKPFAVHTLFDWEGTEGMPARPVRPLPSSRRFARSIVSSKTYCSSLTSQRPCMDFIFRLIARTAFVCPVPSVLQPLFLFFRLPKNHFETSSNNGVRFLRDLMDLQTAGNSPCSWYRRAGPFTPPMLTFKC